MARFLRMRDVLNITGLSRTTLFRRIANNTFPKQRSYGDGSPTVYWLESEIEHWMFSR